MHYHTINPEFYAMRQLSRGRSVSVGYVHFLPETLDKSLKLPDHIRDIFYRYVIRFYKSMDYLVTVNPYFIGELEKYGISREKVTYIPNFVSEEQFYPLPPEEKAALREKYGIPEGKFIVFCAGLLQRRKGFFDYIELARRMPDVLFLWAGSLAFGLISDGHDEIKAILENPPENFRLLGLVERERMNELYNLTDLMLLPSFEELFPMTILEAMNCHAPILLRDLTSITISCLISTCAQMGWTALNRRSAGCSRTLPIIRRQRPGQPRVMHFTVRKMLPECGGHFIMEWYPNARQEQAVEKILPVSPDLPSGGRENNLPPAGKSNRWGILIIVLVAVGSIAGAFLADGPEKIFASLTGADKRWLAAGAGCMLIYWALESGCLHLAARKAWPGQRLRTSVVTSMIGQLFNCVTPFASGGQPIQAYYMTRGGMPVGKATSVLLAKFIVYQTVLALYSAGVLIFEYRNFVENIEGFSKLALIGFIVNAAVVVVLFCVGFFPKITGGFFQSCLLILAKLRIVRDPKGTGAGIDREINSFHQGFTELRRERSVMAAMAVMTTFQLTAFFLVPYCVLMALGVQGLQVGDVVASAAFILMISSFVPLPGASGGAEGSFYVFFQMFFKASGSVSVAILLWRMFTFYLPIVVGVYFARHLSGLNPHSHSGKDSPDHPAG